jgi:D-beta-D-heptose 7-phosphate kinase/D-beta-D-heptose 1-phosphate adenosyltransferase
MTHQIRHIPPFDRGRVLVAGDVMLDRYWTGDTSRVSPEAPVPVVHVRQAEDRPGGAANVALNIASLGTRAAVAGLVGDDEAGHSLTRHLEAAGVHADLETVSGIATVTKLRILSRHQQLIRLDFEDGFDACPKQVLIDRFRQRLAGHDVVVLSDYGKGTLGDTAPFIAAAREAGKPVFVDPKGRDFERYRGATLLTPNVAEFENAVGRCRDEAHMAEKAAALCVALGLEALLITRGDQGISVYAAGTPPRHFPARAREVYDVTGAGDTVIAVLAAAMAVEPDLPNAVALANLAAGLVVGKLGAACVTVPELRRALHDETADRYRVVAEEELVALAAEARLQGQTLVMTNGCFDILHAGHVSYLTRARALGDRLIVAVNDDASVRRLKGPGRPINELDRRMKVLASLACVDWVVPFSEDTPERLIGRVSPDVLVKGGDYRPQAVAGYRHVTASGGRVEILDYEPGCSTSGIIEKIQSRLHPTDQESGLSRDAKQ